MDLRGEMRALEDTFPLEPNLKGIPHPERDEAEHINGPHTHVIPLEELPKGIGIHHSMSDGAGGDTNGKHETITISSLSEH